MSTARQIARITDFGTTTTADGFNKNMYSDLLILNLERTFGIPLNISV